MRALYAHHLRRGLGGAPPRARAAGRASHEIPDEELWAAHRSQKERLIRFVRERVRLQSARHGRSPDELRAVEGLLDPRALTIGFARRFATYKRAVLRAVRPRPPARAPQRPRPPGADRSSPARPTPPTARARTSSASSFLLTQGEFRGQDRLPRGLRHGGRAACWCRAATCGSTRRAGRRRPAAPAARSARSTAASTCSILDGWWAEGYRGDNGWAIGERDARRRPRRSRTARTRRRSTASSRRRWCRCSSTRTTDGLRTRWIAMMKASIASVRAAVQRAPHGARLRGEDLPAARPRARGSSRSNSLQERVRRTQRVRRSPLGALGPTGLHSLVGNSPLNSVFDA